MLIKNTPFDPYLSKSPNGERIIFMGYSFNAASTILDCSSTSLQSANVMNIMQTVKYNTAFFDKVGDFYENKFSGIVRVAFSMVMTSASNGRLYIVNSNRTLTEHCIGCDTGLTISASTSQAFTLNNVNQECAVFQGAHLAFQLRLAPAGSINFQQLAGGNQLSYMTITVKNIY